MIKHVFAAILCLSFTSVFTQKMLLLEQVNIAKTKKFYIGEYMTFKLDGKENYWYKRQIQDILPESNSLLLDQYWVKLEDIAVIKQPPRRVFQILGGAFLSFGVGLTFASTAALLYQDRSQNYPLAYGLAGASLITSKVMLRRRKLHLGEKHRLRIIEIPVLTLPKK